MKRYQVTGKASIAHAILTDHSIGDVVEAELEKDEEKHLVDIGALKVLPAERKQSKSADKDDESEKATEQKTSSEHKTTKEHK